MLAQMEVFGPGGVQPNTEVFAVMEKQLAELRAKQHAAKTVTYDKKRHREVAKAIEYHRVWIAKQLVAEETAILEAEAAIATRRAAYSKLQVDMDAWVLQAEAAVTAAAVLIDPMPMPTTAMESAPPTEQTAETAPHVAHEMGRSLENSRAERAARLAAHQAAVGRPLTLEEVFHFTENACSHATVTALSTVQLTAAAPLMTAVPADDMETNDTTMTTMPANF